MVNAKDYPMLSGRPTKPLSNHHQGLSKFSRASEEFITTKQSSLASSHEPAVTNQRMFKDVNKGSSIRRPKVLIYIYIYGKLLGTSRSLSTTPPEERLCVDLVHIRPKALCCRKSRTIYPTRSLLATFALLYSSSPTNHHQSNRFESFHKEFSCWSAHTQSKWDCKHCRRCTPSRAFLAPVCPSSFPPRGPACARWKRLHRGTQ